MTTEHVNGVPLAVEKPQVAPRGGVLVVQEAFGVNDHIEALCRRFANERWLAVAPHLFHRHGDPRLGYDAFAEVMPQLGALSAENVLADVDAGLSYLDSQGIPSRHTAVVGFCIGGTIALFVATRRPVGAAVTFYGGGVSEGRFGLPALIDVAPQLCAPWLGLFGDLDASIPVDDVEALRIAAAASGQPTDIVRYAEAEHGFHCDARDSYHADSAKDAWAQTLQWLDRRVPASVAK